MAVTGPEGNTPKLTVEAGTEGLLPHELKYLTSAMRVAENTRTKAQAAVGEANANSGGDWAFDDPTTQSAAQEAVLTDAIYQQLKSLHDMGVSKPLISYPEANNPQVRPGSRVTYQTPRWAETVDIVTHRIPGMPEDEQHEVIAVSLESPLGAALLGLVLGAQFSWTTDGTRKFDATVTDIDQFAQRAFYDDVLGEQTS